MTEAEILSRKENDRQPIQARRSQLTEAEILSRKENDRQRIQARRSQLTEAEIERNELKILLIDRVQQSLAVFEIFQFKITAVRPQLIQFKQYYF